MKVSYKDLKPLGMRKLNIPTICLNYDAFLFANDYIVITTSLNKAGKFLIWLTLPLIIVIQIGNTIYEVATENKQMIDRQCLQKNETGRTEKNKEAFDNLMNKLLQK